MIASRPIGFKPERGETGMIVYEKVPECDIPQEAEMHVFMLAIDILRQMKSKGESKSPHSEFRAFCGDSLLRKLDRIYSKFFEPI